MSPTKDPFASFDEKLLVDDVSIISWCPTADLVLLVSTNRSMSLFRNEDVVKKLWTLENVSDSEIELVTWKPNGKEFVFGCRNGIVHKVDITYHEPRVSHCWSPSLSRESEENFSITALDWVNYEFKKKQMDIEGFDVDAFDLESALPMLSENPPEEPVNRLMPRAKKKVKLPPKPSNKTEAQTLLFIGNSKGEIHIILNGIYPIGSININEENQKNTILDISIQHNLSSLQLLTKNSLESNDYFVLQVVDTQLLEDQKEQAFGISEIQTRLSYLLEYARINMDVLKRHHNSYTDLTRAVVRKASNSILSHNEQTAAMPEVELVGTLAIGNVTEALQEFFVESLTSVHIRNWETHTSHGHQNSLKVICEHILPACERIQLELSKLLGYSLWTQRYGDFLQSASVEDCISSVMELVAKIHMFTKDLNSLITSFQAFIKWITIVSLKVTDPNSVEYQNEPSLCEDPELVLEFLNTDFINDSLEKYFVTRADTTQNIRNGFISKNEFNIVFILNEIIKRCSQMLENPSGSISKKMKVISKTSFKLNGVSLFNQPRDKVVSLTMKDEDNVQYNYYAFLQTSSDTKLIILKNNFGKAPTTEYILYNTPGQIIDMEFFDNKELGLCIQIDENTTTLCTVSLQEANFKTLTASSLVCEEFEASRSQTLDRMINVKIGCNGLPRRRIISVVGSNGLMKILSMEEEAEDEVYQIPSNN